MKVTAFSYCGMGTGENAGSSSWQKADGCAPSPRFSRTPLRSHFCEFVRTWRSLSTVGGEISEREFSEERSLEGKSLLERGTED